VIGFGLLLPLFVASPAQAAPASVTVVRGNTLSGLAQRWCGSASKYVNLAAGNGIKNPNLIYPGQVIRLTCAARTTGNTASRSTTRTTTVPASGWVSPLARYSLTSCFGMRWGAMHQGIDMAAPSGTPIRAAHAGVVTRAGWVWHGYGISVVLNNGGVWTHYAHQSRLNVRVGQTVAAGQVIGYVGATGDASGPHLHFEVAGSAGVLGAQRNPAAFLRSHGVNVGC
jgi:murein DD-endopeptidase MepM/ murein hydrolase activator NlpD